MGIARNLAIMAFGLSAGVASVPLLQAQELDFSAVNRGVELVSQALGSILPSFDQVQQEYPGIDIPQPLKNWMNGFSQAPYAGAESVTQDLNNVGSQLSSQYSASDLDAEVASVLQRFVALITTISGEMQAALLGQGNGSVGAELVEITTLHDRDQGDVNRGGLELAGMFQQLDFDGIIGFVNEQRLKFQTSED